MKTKEIECTVLCDKSKEINEKNVLVTFSEKDITDFDKYKAKLIIEIPERKIEITESNLEHALRGLLYKTELDRIKKELGFFDE